jgi:uncharacterized membrane protein YeaQ/YmgE (transglycosylase-associated protein family)
LSELFETIASAASRPARGKCIRSEWIKIADSSKSNRRIESWLEYPFPIYRDRSGDAGKKYMEELQMIHLLWTALIGLIVGAIAKFIMPGKDPGGIFVTMLIGIAGAFLGTYLGRAIGHYQPDQSAGFLMSLLGALILLGIYHLIRRARTVSS